MSAVRLPHPAEVTAIITIAGLDQIIVCLRCYGELRTWRPETLDAFRAWHSQHCGVREQQQRSQQPFKGVR